MNSKQAMKWVEKQGIVLQSARGPVPNFVEWAAGEKVHGSWWAHPRAHEIYLLAETVCDSGEVLVCKLIDRKVTYVHRRMWPALVRLAKRFSPAQLAQIESVHTSSGKHVLKVTPYPKWVPTEIKKATKLLSEKDAVGIIGKELLIELTAPPGR
jgi:hypothetical protein